MALALWLVAVLAVAGALVLRTQGWRWDRGTLVHPDERHLALVTARPVLPSTPLALIAGETTPLNPRPQVLHAYGLLPVTVTRLAAELVGVSGAVGVALIGRLLGTAADLMSLLALGWIGRRVFGPGVALLAMALYACAVLPIQQSHFFVVDPWLTASATIAIAALMVIHQRAGHAPGVAATAGVAAGAAVACKLTGVLLVVPASAVLLSGLWTARVQAGRMPWRWTVVLLVAALVSVRLMAPDMFAPWSVRPSATWLADMRVTLDMLNGLDWPPTHQWARRPAWFPLWNAVAFGFGWPLGLTVVIATAAASWRVLGDWRHPLLVPAIWVLTVVGATSLHLVATMRYLLPAYPAACLIAAWLLVAVVRRAETRGPASRRMAFALVAFVLGGTVIWALAFTHVYRVLHPRLQASRWIYDNVPAGATIAVEHWDEALPLQAGTASTPLRYRILTLPVTDPDTPAKRDHLLAALQRADYVVLSSDRHAHSLVRLPERFPMMVRYYDGLADGTLGFALARQVVVRPALGPWSIATDAADEAFSVYDHPRVRVFRKTAGWSVERARKAIEVADWGAVLPLTAAQASAAPNLLMLHPDRRAGLVSEGTWRRSRDTSGRFAARPPTDRRAVLRWLAWTAVAGVSALPICLSVFSGAYLRGALLAPAFGLFWIAWVSWLWGTFAPRPLSWGVVAGACGLLASMASCVAWPARRRLWSWLRANGAHLAIAVLLLAVLGAFALATRWLNPDLWHPTLGGEKPMDIAILSALVRADRFPVADPWFAGGVLNYYWFGHLPVALLCRLTGVEPAVGYNLAVATWWVLTAAGAATAGATLARTLAPAVRPGVAAIVAAVVATLLGNLTQIGVIVRGTLTSIPAWEWFWTASRAIPTPAGHAPPITEFPYFTFLFADLHAHLLAMPVLLAGLLVATIVAVGPAGAGRSVVHQRVVLLCIGGWLLGLLSAINPWNAPVLAGLLGAAVLLDALWQRADTSWPMHVRRAVVSLVVVATVAVLASSPFWQSYGAPAGGVRPWRGPRTPVGDWLALWAPFLVPLVSAVLLAWRGRIARPVTRGLAWLAMLLALGLGLLVGVEVAVIAGDVGRTNTVFKTYLAVWLIWSAAAAAAMAYVDACQIGSRRRWIRGAAAGAALGMAAYPLTATGARVSTRMAAHAPPALDGRAFLDHAELALGDLHLPLAEDARAIEWLLDHVVGTPVVLEAQTPQYGWGGRISAHTGLPTVLGWTWHTHQQRMALPAELTARRRRDVRAFYTTRDAAEANGIAARHDVTYVVVGRLERAMYPRDGLARLDADPAWEVVFTTGATRIYRRR